jgi:hypothetical protein
MTLLIFSKVFAAPSKAKISLQQTESKKIQSLVTSYYLSKAAKARSFVEALTFGVNDIPGCDPNHPAPPNVTNCINIACDHLGEYGCDQASEIQAVATACRGVDGACVQSSCNHLGPYGCDQMVEIQNVTNVCRDVFDSRCMDVVCRHLGEYGCDQMVEIQNVAKTCSGRVDPDCIESVCQRLGEYGCDQMVEIENVARTCTGN